MNTPTQDEAYETLAKAEEGCGSRWPGMTYEQGVAAAILWMLGEGDNPMEDE
jgi:hypothetical protein